MPAILRCVSKAISPEKESFLKRYIPDIEIIECGGEIYSAPDPVQWLKQRIQSAESDTNRSVFAAEIDLYYCYAYSLVKLVELKYELGVILIHAEYEAPPVGRPFPSSFVRYEEVEFVQAHFRIKPLFK